MGFCNFTWMEREYYSLVLVTCEISAKLTSGTDKDKIFRLFPENFSFIWNTRHKF